MYNNQSKKYSFNIVDIVLIIIAIAVLLFLTNYFLFNYGFLNKDNTNINYVLKTELLGDSINVGDVVYGDDSNTIGVVKRLEYINSTDNVSENAQDASYNKTVLVTVNAIGRKNSGRYYLNSNLITAGKTYTLRLSDFVTEALCVNVYEN